MKLTFRLRPSSRISQFALCGTLLLSFASTALAADYPGSSASPSPKRSSTGVALTNSAKAALFEQNDPQRAASLAQRTLRHSPRDIDAWFLLAESSALNQNSPRELEAVLAVCRLALKNDPRSVSAGGLLASFGQNSEAFRQQRALVASLAATDSACAVGAREALYNAALDGLNSERVRELAQQSGWQTRWTVARTGASASKFLPEQFEFANARMTLPDYLPRAASYAATTSYDASRAGEYLIGGETSGAKLSVDGHPFSFGRLPLSAGIHDIQITFRAEDSSPRIQITPAISFDDLRWTGLHLSARESLYLQAAVVLAAGDDQQSSELLQHSDLAQTEIGKELIKRSQFKRNLSPGFESAFGHPSCGNVEAALVAGKSPGEDPKLLRSCAPDSLAFARWLSAAQQHAEAINEINRVIGDWPLDRDARRLLIFELQRIGNSSAADRAAADFLTVAPNARDFRRMAQNATAEGADSGIPFFETYRRSAPAPLPAFETSIVPEVILLQDKVSISRIDGSVSTYVHRVVELMTNAGAGEFKALAIPEGAQLLTARVVNENGRAAGARSSMLKPGDEVEEEYVVNYTGDGGMIAHSEAFQYVFNDFDFPLLNARFIVLSPAKESPGYVIASGEVPEFHMQYVGGLSAQIWEQERPSVTQASHAGIVRVVENENGWSIPPSVERRRNLETIHPGPRPREA